MSILISRIGSEHIYANRNVQDFAIGAPGLKMVMDGCGSTAFPEVGAMLFGQLMLRQAEDITVDNFKDVVNEIFSSLMPICSDDIFKINNFSFTILACLETENEFVVFSCGDGYILAQADVRLSRLKLDDGEYPKYYIYNYIADKSLLKQYAEGVDFTITRFNKCQYSRVGVATDGFRYAPTLSEIERIRFFEFLLAGKNGKLGMLLNRNTAVFKDDISISF